MQHRKLVREGGSEQEDLVGVGVPVEERLVPGVEDRQVEQ
jgi:hypothetical protein